MEASSRTPDMIVVGGDEEDQIQVQPVAEGGARSIEIHLWRRGPADAPPARDVLDLDLADLDSLLQGVSELLEASDGGTHVARIVLDTAEGRRLRVETEPFGTRFVARVVFWQRTRATWRPDGDPIVIAADVLPALHGALTGLRPWLNEPLDRQMTAAVPIVPEPWPNPGGDWMTVDRSSVAFHPRGVRITCSIEQAGDDHCLEIRQWRREDSLWVPERVRLTLSVADLDALLSALHGLSSRTEPQSVEVAEKLRVSITGDAPDLVVDRRVDDGYERCLAFPLEYLPRFGRALAQSFTLLVGWLSDSERQQLREDRHPEPGDTAEMPAIGAPLPSPSGPRPIGPTFRFGGEGDTPGMVIPQEGQVRIILEGYLMPRGLTLPATVLSQVIIGLEELFERQKTESRVAPLLMCERPDCAVYGRVGTNIRPDAVELRVWTGPRDSDAVTFEKVYLADVIEALRESLRLLGQPEPLPMPTGNVSPPTGGTEREADLDLTAAIPAVTPEPEPEPVHVGDIEVASRHVHLDLIGREEGSVLRLSWNDEALGLPMNGLDGLLSDVRALYYDAVRGVRGRTLTVADPPVEIALVSRASILQLEVRGADATLAFPASETPGFLIAVREALKI